MFSKACLVASVTPYIWQIHIIIARNVNDCKEAAMTVPQRVLDTMNSGLIYTCDDEEMIKA